MRFSCFGFVGFVVGFSGRECIRGLGCVLVCCLLGGCRRLGLFYLWCCGFGVGCVVR